MTQPNSEFPVGEDTSGRRPPCPSSEGSERDRLHSADVGKITLEVVDGLLESVPGDGAGEDGRRSWFLGA